MLINKKVKYTAQQVDEIVENVRDEYEADCSKQKQRIIELRDENNALKEQIKGLDENKSMVLAAMVSAQKSAKDVIESAKCTAADMISAAEEREREADEAVKGVMDSLDELRERCEGILSAIDENKQKYGMAEASAIKTAKRRPSRSA